MYKPVPLEALIGKTVIKTVVEGERIEFLCSDGSKFLMEHQQDCCESVYITDSGGAEGLEGSILSIQEENPDGPVIGDYDESYTWTFFHIVTEHGVHVIKWYGTSNGYYSESVDFFQTEVEAPQSL